MLFVLVLFRLKLSMLNRNALIWINTKFHPESLLQYLDRLDDKYLKKLQHNFYKNCESILIYRYASDSKIFQYKPWLVKFAIVIVFKTSDHNLKDTIKTFDNEECLFNNIFQRSYASTFYLKHITHNPQDIGDRGNLT